MPEPVAPLSGHCMCGAVAFTLSAPLQGALYCHCTRCQRRTGTAFSVSGRIEPGSFELTRGADAVREWRPPDGGWLKAYCADCGGHLYAKDPENPDQMAVRLGALDQDPGVRPAAHQFVDYAAPWSPLPDDGLPRFAERMSWE